MNNGRLTRLRYWVIALTMVVVFAAFAAPIMVVFFVQQESSNTIKAITCVSAQANIDQLQAQASLHRRLGVPIDFDIPTLPEECE